ncbi:MAG: glutathione synthase [Candidatus Tokpelaia sp.]|nr:MAG: glutathione synthase [Candidatus Tokpelaia sp.]KAA6206066.1 MAG: glutathione synthase [Candidatus Tokpelaia sp.]
MKIAVQMDDIAAIRIAGDTSFALCLEAQKRGHTLFYYTPDKLLMENGEVFAHIKALRVADKQGAHFKLGVEKRTPLSEMDIVLLRQDPPFDMNYITATHLLERVGGQTRIVNNPFWVRNSPEKIFVTEFPDLMPATLISRDRAEIEAFRRHYGDIIVKPLYGNGGAGVFYLKKADGNLSSLLEMFARLYPEPFMMQRYVPAVRHGDKRIILIDGEFAGAINRVPAKGGARANMHIGGRAEKTELTARERQICARLKPFLQQRGLFLVGIDVIGDYITEINVTSPTGLREIKKFGGADIAAIFWDRLEEQGKIKA